MSRKVLWLIPTLALMACKPTQVADVVVVDTDDAVEEVSRLAAGLQIDKISIYQGVEIVLYDPSGTIPEIQAPILRKRQAMVRIHVNPADEWEVRQVQAVVTVTDNQGENVFTSKRRVEGKSKQSDLATTLNVDIPAEFITQTTRFSVEIVEADEDGIGGGDEADLTWASDGLDLDKTDSIEIVVFPIKYNADGSGRLPDTSDAQLERMRNGFLAMYPASDVTITVGETLNWNNALNANGNGWSNLLDQMSVLRDDANVDPNTYYYGLFNPANSLGQYCSYGCVLGLSNLAWGTSDDWYKSSIGLGYSGSSTVDTMLHEVGHAHGREHAPCGLGGQSSDRDYPYADADLGTWGYDMLEKELKKPTNDVKDMMSYCSPIWVSDYTYYSLWQQIKAVGENRRSAARQPWQAIRVDMDGTTHVGEIYNADPAQGGERTTVELHDANGAYAGEVEGYFYPYSHIAGGTVLIPVQDFALSDVRVPGLQ